MEINDTQSAIDAGMALSKVQQVEPEGAPFVIIPENGKLVTVGHLLPEPQRIVQQPQFYTLESFIRYVDEFKTAETAIFCMVGDVGGSLTAYLDYHGVEAPSWSSHTAHYECPLSPEWRVWTSHNTLRMPQCTFADFIESNLIDITEPAGAVMLEIAQTLSAIQSCDFMSGVRSDNGNQRLRYIQNTAATGGKNGELEVPAIFKITVPCFVGGINYKVEARLKYRITGKEVAFWYELVRPHRVIEDAVKTVIQEVKSKTTINPFMGDVQ